MKNTVFLLTNSKSNEILIRNSIGIDYEINCINKFNLMIELYQKNPEVLIVDVDGFESQTIEMIQSILDIKYLPIIYVYSERSNLNELIKNEIVIPIEKIQNSILYLIKQATIFKGKYYNVMESYDAIDLLNGEVKSLLKKYVDM